MTIQELRTLTTFLGKDILMVDLVALLELIAEMGEKLRQEA